MYIKIKLTANAKIERHLSFCECQLSFVNVQFPSLEKSMTFKHAMPFQGFSRKGMFTLNFLFKWLP